MGRDPTVLLLWQIRPNGWTLSIHQSDQSFSFHRTGGVRGWRQEQQVLMPILLLSEKGKQKPSAYGGKEVFLTHGPFCRVCIGQYQVDVAVLLVRAAHPMPLLLLQFHLDKSCCGLGAPIIQSHLLQCPPLPTQSIRHGAFAYLLTELCMASSQTGDNRQ